MIKPHTTAKLQQTKLLGIRGEGKVNKKKEKECESNKGNERKERERQGRDNTQGEKSLVVIVNHPLA